METPGAPPEEPGRGMRWTVLAILLLGAVGLYWTPVLRGGLVLDDRLFLEQDARLSDPGERIRIWTTPLFDGPSLGRPWVSPEALASYYRPLVLLSLFTAQDLLGPSPVHHHLFNVLAHGLLAALLALWLARRGAARAGFLAGLLFLVHPAGPEVVGWISGRSDLLAVLATLLALLLLDAPDDEGEGRGREVLAGLAYLAACLSKETALLLGPLLPFQTWLLGRGAGRGLRVFLPVTGLYLALRLGALGTLLPTSGRSPDLDPAVLLSGLWRWLQHLLAPWDLRLLFYPSDHGAARLGVLDGVALALLVLLVAGAVLAWRSDRDRPALAATRWLGGALVVLPLLPVSGVLPLAYPFSDRYLYASVAGLSLLVGGILPALPAWLGRPTRAALLLLCLVHGGLLVARNQAFTSPRRFLEVAREGAMGRWRAHHFLAEELLREGRPEAALPVLEEGLALHPRAGALWLARGVALRQLGRPEEALEVFATVPQDGLYHPVALCHRISLLRERGEEDAAATLAEEGLAGRPDHPGLRALRGEMRLDRGEARAALRDLEVALGGQPLDAPTHFHRGLALHRLGKLGEAIEAVHRAHRLDRDHPRFAGALGRLLVEAGEVEEARRWLALARRLEAGAGGARGEGESGSSKAAPKPRDSD